MNVLEIFKPIKVFVFDVDGVMTDGSLQLMPGGELMRSVQIKDGLALKLAVENGYQVVVISGGKSEAVRQRLNGLGIKEIHLGIQDKKEKLEELAIGYDWQWEQVLYMGDDVPDYYAMQMVGLAVCPQDAAPEIKAISRYISPYAGGQTCVRDVIEKVLKQNGDWKF